MQVDIEFLLMSRGLTSLNNVHDYQRDYTYNCSLYYDQFAPSIYQ